MFFRAVGFLASKLLKSYIGVAFCAVFEFQKSSHLQPLAATRVAASGRSVEWPQVTASGRLRRVAEVFQSHKKQPLAATRSHSSGRKWPLFPSGREWPLFPSGRKWPPLPHNVMNSKLRKTPTRSRRQPTYPSQLEKEHLSNKTYFFKMFKTIAKKHSLTLTKTAKNTQSQPPAAYPSISTWKKTPFQQNIFFQDVHWKRRRVIRHKPFIKRTSLTLKRRVSQKKKGFFKKEEFLSTRNMIKKEEFMLKKEEFLSKKSD